MVSYYFEIPTQMLSSVDRYNYTNNTHLPKMNQINNFNQSLTLNITNFPLPHRN